MSRITTTENTLYLTFKLHEEVFSIDVSQVREVLDLPTVTKVPRAPSYLRGVINVRGNVVPVIDLRIKFGLPPAQNTVNTRVIVMELQMEEELVVIGAVADSVHDVLEIPADRIEPPPRIANHRRTEYIRGIGKRDEQFIMIMDVERVFSAEVLSLIENNGNDTTALETDTVASGAA